MTFGPLHYVPILKIKRGEKAALRSLPPAVSSYITPLLEIVERNPDKTPTIDAHLKAAFRDLAKSTEPYRRCLLDTRELALDDPSASIDAYQRATNEGMAFSPVTGMSRTAETVAAAMEYRAQGIALRVTRDEFENGHLPARIDRFLNAYRLAPESVDLVIDLGSVTDLVMEGIILLTRAFLSEIDHITRWRTVTVSGCAFPMSMKGIERDSDVRVERMEWLAWRDGLFADRQSLARLPSFSDCAIQHPKGVEGFDFRTMQVSAAARYTLASEWLLVKGVSTRRRLPSAQFPAIARHLVEGRLRAYFRGPEHCDGCYSIKAAAEGSTGFGSAEAWRRLGTIHHLTCVTEALAALP